MAALQKKRIAAIDYGMARIGLALSDEMQIIATPLCTLTAEKTQEKSAAKVMQELSRQPIEEIIIGLPLLLSGKTGLLADEVRSFVEHLKKLTSIPIITWDERLTTVQAERAMREGSMTRKKRSQFVDTVAAVILLQSYLDFKGIKKVV